MRIPTDFRGFVGDYVGSHFPPSAQKGSPPLSRCQTPSSAFPCNPISRLTADYITFSLADAVNRASLTPSSQIPFFVFRLLRSAEVLKNSPFYQNPFFKKHFVLKESKPFLNQSGSYMQVLIIL